MPRPLAHPTPKNGYKNGQEQEQRPRMLLASPATDRTPTDEDHTQEVALDVPIIHENGFGVNPPQSPEDT
jgi:hypothetical protein